MYKRILVSIFVLGVVQIAFMALPLGATFLPSPLDVVMAFVMQIRSGEIFIDIAMSLQRVLGGFLIATIFAVPLAMLCGYSQRVYRWVNPIIELLRPIPPIAWIPLAILFFGLGDSSAYFIVFLGAFFPIFINTYFGAISLPVVYRHVAQSFEIKKSIYITRILFYFSLPYIFTGLKIGIGMAWMSVIASELISAQSGLGYFIQLNRLLLRTDNIIVGMILIGGIGYMLTVFLSVAERIAMPWRAHLHQLK